jgi:hypothetical protein
MSKRYHSYLLRLWQPEGPEKPAWRASLEDPATRKVTSFNSLEGLFEFLLQLLNSPENDRGSSPQSTPPIVNLISKKESH